MQFLYREGNDYVFMDTETYDQRPVPTTSLGDSVDYLVENSNVVLMLFGEEIIGTDMPASVELTIADTEPGMQGDRGLGRHEARDARDRSDRPGAPLCRTR